MANDTDIASVLYQDSSGRLTPVGRENFLRGVVNGLIYILAETLMDPTLVLVSFVSSLTNNPLLIGLIVPLRDGTWYLPQLFVSGRVQSMPRKIEHYKIYSYVRTVLWILLALSINLIREPVFLLVAFFLTYGGVSLASGLCGLSFLEVVSKTIPARRRGEFYALRFGFGSLLGVGGSLGVRWLLDPTSPVQFPANFGVLSIAYAALASFSLFLYNGVHEHPDENLRPASPFGEQIKRAWYYIRTDPNYFRFLSMQSSLIIGGMATPIFCGLCSTAAGWAARNGGGCTWRCRRPPTWWEISCMVVCLINPETSGLFNLLRFRVLSCPVWRWGWRCLADNCIFQESQPLIY